MFLLGILLAAFMLFLMNIEAEEDGGMSSVARRFGFLGMALRIIAEGGISSVALRRFMGTLSLIILLEVIPFEEWLA